MPQDDFKKKTKRPTQGGKRSASDSNGGASVSQKSSNPEKKAKGAKKFGGKPAFNGSKKSFASGKGKGKPAFKGKGKPADGEAAAGQPKLLKSKSGKTLPATRNDQRQLKEGRRRDGDANYDLKKELKQLWQNAREKKMKSEDRMPHLNKMLELAKGKIMEMIFQHDAARVIQCMIRYGSPEIRAGVFDELKDSILDLCKSKYSRHIVPKLLQFGNRKQRNHIITAFYGHVRKLIRQRIANEVVATAYIDYATSKQRTALVQEFYGPQFAVFQTEEVSTLEDFITAHPEKKPFVVKHIKQTLKPLLEKGLCQHHIVHRVLLDYIKIAPDENKEDLIEEIKELLVEMVHTRDGAALAMEVLKHSSAKMKKSLLRSFKPYVKKICCEQYGLLVILAIFDTVDDTVLVNKTILSEIFAETLEIAQDPNGRKVLFYLISPRDPHFFYPQMVEKLASLDANPFSKKDTPVRRAELQKFSEKPLLALVQEHASSLCVEGEEALLLAEIIKKCKTNQAAMHGGAVDAVVSACLAAENPLYEHPSGHKAIRKIIQGEGSQEIGDFTVALSNAIATSGDTLAAMANCNRGAFVLLSVLESPKTDAKIAKVIANNVLDMQADIAESKGATLLVQASTAVKEGKVVSAPTSHTDAPTVSSTKAEEEDVAVTAVITQKQPKTPATPKGKAKAKAKAKAAGKDGAEEGQEALKLEEEMELSQDLGDEEEEEDSGESQKEEEELDEDEDEDENDEQTIVPPHTPKGKSPVLTRAQRRKSMRAVGK